MFSDIYSDAGGNRTLVPGLVMAPFPDKWTATGWHGGGSPCEAIVVGDYVVLGSLLKNMPAFSLDKLGDQTFQANSSAICSSMRDVLIDKWNTVPDQPGVQQSCSVDAEWTINVKWAQDAGQ